MIYEYVDPNIFYENDDRISVGLGFPIPGIPAFGTIGFGPGFGTGFGFGFGPGFGYWGRPGWYGRPGYWYGRPGWGRPGWHGRPGWGRPGWDNDWDKR